MNNSIQIFGSDAFGEIRTMVDEHNEPLFCLKDVCRALELDSHQVTRRLDRGVVSKHPLRTSGGTQMVTFVNEDGLYDTILDSRKPEAKAFRKWGDLGGAAFDTQGRGLHPRQGEEHH